MLVTHSSTLLLAPAPQAQGRAKDAGVLAAPLHPGGAPFPTRNLQAASRVHSAAARRTAPRTIAARGGVHTSAAHRAQAELALQHPVPPAAKLWPPASDDNGGWGAAGSGTTLWRWPAVSPLDPHATGMTAWGSPVRNGSTPARPPVQYAGSSMLVSSATPFELAAPTSFGAPGFARSRDPSSLAASSRAVAAQRSHITGGSTNTARMRSPVRQVQAAAQGGVIAAQERGGAAQAAAAGCADDVVVAAISSEITSLLQQRIKDAFDKVSDSVRTMFVPASPTAGSGPPHSGSNQQLDMPKVLLRTNILRPRATPSNDPHLSMSDEVVFR